MMWSSMFPNFQYLFLKWLIAKIIKADDFHLMTAHTPFFSYMYNREYLKCFTYIE